MSDLKWVDYDDGHAGGYPHMCDGQGRELVVTTPSGFRLLLVSAGFDKQGNQLWRQTSAHLGARITVEEA